jgi:hypothetical protein
MKAVLGGLARLSAVLVLLGCAQSLHAQTFDFSFSGGGFSASGVMTTTLVSGDEYLVTSISGAQNGSAMTLLGVGAYGSNDNLIFTTPPYLDVAGVSFSVMMGGVDYNVYYDAGLAEYLECSSAVYSICYEGDGVTLTSFALAPTPEPGSMLLFGTGFLLIGGILRRRLA